MWMYSLGLSSSGSSTPSGDLWRRLQTHSWNQWSQGAPPPAKADHSPKDKTQMMESVSDPELFYLGLHGIQKQLLERNGEDQETLERKASGLRVWSYMLPSQLHHLSVERHWATQKTSQSLLLLICKRDNKTLSSHRSWVSNTNDSYKNAQETLTPQHTCKLWYSLTDEMPVAGGNWMIPMHIVLVLVPPEVDTATWIQIQTIYLRDTRKQEGKSEPRKRR